MQPSAAPTCSEPKSPADQLRDLTLILRSDLHVSRQLHQGIPVYVVHDPVSFRTHRLSLQNYQILVRLDPGKTLGQNFDTLVAQKHFSASDQEFYYQFVLQLHQLGLIVLPVSSGSKLFEQHEKISRTRRRSRIYGALFLQIPLVQPDMFLTRTAPHMKWLFSRAFFAVWCLAACTALAVVLSRFDEFLTPISGLLATENLPFLWSAFVVLKIWHELGHGYACKTWGGAVPEMGMLLIVGTPAAYVDATAAWSFPERWKRLIVMLGGMYFETLVAIPAVFVWAFSASPMLSSCAYQLVMMASLITVLFNANPLMKYDGYFIAGELLGIRNLRGRADLLIKELLKQIFLGLPPKQVSESRSERRILICYGIAASIYKILLVIGIAMMIAQKFPLIGLAIAGFQLATTVGSTFLSLGRFLLFSSETAGVRTRARLLAAVTLIGLPLSTLVIPVPFGVVAQGVVAAQTEHYLNADTPGNFDAVHADPGQAVKAGSPLATLRNPEVMDRHRSTQAALQEALLEWEITRNRDLAAAARLEPRVRELKFQLLETQRQVNSLEIKSPAEGLVAKVLPNSQNGRFLGTGETVAIVVSGRALLRTWVTEDQLGSLNRETGAAVTFRIPGDARTTYSARLLRIEPAAESASLSHALTFLSGGEILVNSQTGLPLEPLFQVDVEPADDSSPELSSHGSRVSLNLPRRRQSIASWVVSRITRFVNKTLMM